MTSVTYKAKSGKTQFMPTLAHAEELMEAQQGFCLACGESQSAEPDARKYACEACGEHKVYGVEELVLMGLVR
jgi:predicted RNA-binding Zn-ribbon protein involved in translation (DUF1610 family)